MTRSNNNKLRAVFLAALMVLWVFAGAIALGGNAAALDDTGITSNGMEASPDAAGETATYSIDLGFAGQIDTDVKSAEVDLTNASSNGVDASDVSASDITVEYVNDSSGSTSTLDVENVSASSDELAFDFERITPATTGNDQLNFTIEGIQNPGAGGSDYDITARLYSGAEQSGDSQSVVDQLSITAPTGGSNNLPDYADDTWATGEIRFVGQQLALFTDSSGNGDYRIHEVDYDANQQVRSGTQLSVRDDGTIRIRTSNREGDYIITEGDGSGNRQQITSNSDGVQNGVSEDGLENANSSSVVSIDAQDLDVDFVDEDEDELDEVRQDEEFNVLILSNRNDFTLEVTSDNFDEDDLQDLFSQAEELESNDIEQDSDDNSILLDGISADHTFTNLSFGEDGADLDDTGNFTFDFDVDDTSASDSVTISVDEESDAEATFDNAVYPGYEGDVVSFSLEVDDGVDEVNITVGNDDDQGYESYFVAEPNDDNEIEIEMNTYLAGQSTANEDEVFTAEEGNIDESSVTLVSDTLPRHLEAGPYDISVNSVPADGGEPEELDLASLELQERHTGDITVHRAPYTNSQFNDLAEIEDILEQFDEGRVTETNEVAINSERDSQSARGDIIVHEVDVSGIYGAVAANNGELPNGIVWDIEQTNPTSNRNPKSLNLSESSNIHHVFDNENQTYYFIAQSDGLQFNRTAGGAVSGAEVDDEFEAKLNVTGDYLNDFSRDDLETPDDDEQASGEYTIVDREVEFDTVNDLIIVDSAPDQTISGDTTVAPATELRLRARASGEEQAFLKTAEVEVEDDGSFEAVFDGDDSFEDVEIGRNFTVTIPQQSFEDEAETDGQVQEGEFAQMSISDVTATEGEEVSTITVDSAFLPRGGYVSIHDGTVLDGADFDSIRGTSDYLSEGEHENVEIELDDPYTEDGDAIAIAYQETSDNQEFDFVDSEGEDDTPYEDAQGDAISEGASVTFEAEPTPTPSDDDGPTPTDSPEDDDGEDDQLGFGAVVALIAILGAALLAARRRALN